MNFQYPTLLAYAALAYCIWNSWGLVPAWNPNTIYERYVWTLFIIWLIPFFYWSYKNNYFFSQNHFIPNQILLGCSVLISCLGKIGALHILNNISLALAVSAFIPFSFVFAVWLCVSFAWMPQISWFLSHIVPNYIPWYFIVRFLMVAIGSSGLLLKLKKRT
jgi:hypothetical protein